MTQKNNITVLLAPLDWGLGHATRCIPIIRYLLLNGCKVVLATAGLQEKLLKQEFPFLPFVTLPGYDIRYTNSKRLFNLKILQQLPKIISSVRKENNVVKKYIEKNPVDVIISDNRYGFFHPAVPSVFITHQLCIKAPSEFLEKIIKAVNYKLIRNFKECWIPDDNGNINLSGALSHPSEFPKIPVRFIGCLSRLEVKENIQKKYDLLVILSGPEPQRTVLEKILFDQLNYYEGKVLFARGLPGSAEQIFLKNNITIVSFLDAPQLQAAFAASERVICRSGYTSIMDIIKMKMESILIATPGQTEQEYLARHLQDQQWCLSVEQENFILANALLKAKSFDYQLPQQDMEHYKTVITDFLENLSQHKQ